MIDDSIMVLQSAVVEKDEKIQIEKEKQDKLVTALNTVSFYL
jgi:hypothetical protein